MFVSSKGNETHFGYKHHIVIDPITKVITNQAATPANINDIEMLVELVEEDKTLFALGDSGYKGKDKEEQLAAKSVILHTVKKRKRGEKELSEQDKAYNKKISRVRCRVEHVFGSIKQMSGDFVRSIGLKRCRRFTNIVSLCYNMQRFGFLCRAGQLCPAQ